MKKPVVMKQVGVYEAKTRLPSILKRVSKGERIMITKHGTPLAQLIPAGESQVAPEEVISALRSFPKGLKLGRLSLSRMIKEGRR